jgi:RHH-type transcriptional regulator, proline utilization regulon repressor / proline dehydrogenase / delta 1-pyrroline-5-carboxylate dehydrogenase
MASPLVPYHPPHIDVSAVDRAVAAGYDAPRVDDRSAMLHRVADSLARHRGELLHVMAVEAGKTIVEGDPEVSEAIDFARYYARSIETIDEIERDSVTFEPYRLTVVAAPWNFPLAIPAGGVLAALAAGSAVILKPAPETRHTARELAACFWKAGVPEDLFQLLPCDDDDAGRRLITHEDVDAVILTGAYDTARLFLDWAPAKRVHAETREGSGA